MAEKGSQGKWRRFIPIVLGGTLGVALLIFGGELSEDKETQTPSNEEVGIYDDADAYADMLETRIEKICSGVRGAGKVEVLVSLKGGYRTVYAIDSQSSGSGYKSEIVMSGSGSDKRAVVSAYENPEIAGVGIICTGGGDAKVRAEIISLVSAALDVSTNKIFVAKSE